MNLVQAIKKAGKAGTIWRSSEPQKRWKFDVNGNVPGMMIEDALAEDWYGSEAGLFELIAAEEQLTAEKLINEGLRDQLARKDKELVEMTQKMLRNSDRVSELERGIESLYMQSMGFKEVKKFADRPVPGN